MAAVSVPETGFRIESKAMRTWFPALKLLLAPSNFHSNGTYAVSAQSSTVEAMIDHGIPSNLPLKTSSNALLCPSEAVSSMNSLAVALPSCTAPGHLALQASFRPSSLVSPHMPDVIWIPQVPSQEPFVGLALKLHGHPQSQLHALIISAR